MNPKMRRAISLIAASSALVLMAACGGGGGTPTTSSAPTAEGPVPEPTAAGDDHLLLLGRQRQGDEGALRQVQDRAPQHHRRVPGRAGRGVGEEADHPGRRRQPAGRRVRRRQQCGDLRPAQGPGRSRELHEPQRHLQARRLRRRLPRSGHCRRQDVRAALRRRVDRSLLPQGPVRGRRHRRAPQDLGGVHRRRAEADRSGQEAVRLPGLRPGGRVLLLPVAVAERWRTAERGREDASCSTTTPARRPPTTTSVWPSTPRRTT